MKGRIAVIDHIDGRQAAALIVDGRLQDLLIDPAGSDAPRTGAIYRAVAERPLKNQNGLFVDFGGGQKGFLRQAKGVAQGQRLLVQVNTEAEQGKASPVTRRLLFKGRYAILTPEKPGRNIARSITDEAERDRLAEVADAALSLADPDLGLILRSGCDGTDAAAILDEISGLLKIWTGVSAEADGAAPALLMAAPKAAYLAWRDWTNPDPDQVFEQDGSFRDHGVCEMIDDLLTPSVKLSQHASMFIEPTRALVAIDVNTGGDFSYSAGLKSNLAAAADLPRQLRLRGLGGQIVVDFAPMSKKDRRHVEHALTRAFKSDGIDTTLVGWTPLGHLELQRKRARLPLCELVAAGYKVS